MSAPFIPVCPRTGKPCAETYCQRRIGKGPCAGKPVKPDKDRPWA